MDFFDSSKKRYMDNLYKPDKSKQGFVDPQIAFVLDTINSLDNFYTTSSCAGRYMVFRNMTGLKCDAEWIYSSHDYIDSSVIKDVLNNISGRGIVWFKVEGVILHICCRTLDDAKRLMSVGKRVGLKRTGIFSISKRIIVEIVDTVRLDSPVMSDGNLLVTSDFIDLAVLEATKKLKKSREKIAKFESELKKEFLN